MDVLGRKLRALYQAHDEAVDLLDRLQFNGADAAVMTAQLQRIASYRFLSIFHYFLFFSFCWKAIAKMIKDLFIYIIRLCSDLIFSLTERPLVGPEGTTTRPVPGDWLWSARCWLIGSN